MAGSKGSIYHIEGSGRVISTRYFSCDHDCSEFVPLNLGVGLSGAFQQNTQQLTLQKVVLLVFASQSYAMILGMLQCYRKLEAIQGGDVHP